MAVNTSDKHVTFPNVRVAKSNMDQVTVGLMVDLVLYDQYFAVVGVDNHNQRVVTKFGSPRYVRTQKDKNLIEVETYDGWQLSFTGGLYFVDWICQEFKRLQK